MFGSLEVPKRETLTKPLNNLRPKDVSTNELPPRLGTIPCMRLKVAAEQRTSHSQTMRN